MSATQRAMAGAVAWLAFVAVRVPSPYHGVWAHAVLLLAALVLVPLALELAADSGQRDRVWWCIALSRLGQTPAALLLGWSCLRAPGDLTALLSLPWLVVCGLTATAGWLRLRHGLGRRPLEKLCGDIALLFLGIGGAWVFADRAGYQPLKFPTEIVTLTAVHFHFAGLLLPLVAGRIVGAFPASRMAMRAAVGAVLGVPAVALGITATQLGWGPAFEAASGCGLALAGMAVAILHVRLALDREVATPVGPMPPLRRGLMLVAGASLFFGMVLAAGYALRSFSESLLWLNIPWMRAVHGTVNALGFGACGVLAWGKWPNKKAG